MRRLAQTQQIPLIEDCSQAHGALVDGRPVGSLGDAAAFSLNATKLLAGPEGGLLTANREDVYNRAARIRVFGVSHREGKAIVRNTDCLGYSYRTNEMISAFAQARLESFDSEQRVRVENACRLTRGLRGLPGLQLPKEVPGTTHVYQMYRIRLDPRGAGVDMAPELFRSRVLALRPRGRDFWTWEVRSLPSTRSSERVTPRAGDFRGASKARHAT